MFLRFGQVVGHSGILEALLIVVFSKAITTLTAFSLSAVATNTRVRGGGAYYLISRSLGVELGGAIGVVFFLAQAISVAMYVIGFTEALLGTTNLGLSFQETATIVNVLVFVCVYAGAAWTIKLQYVILAALGMALVSFYVGAGLSFDVGHVRENLKPRSDGPGFMAMFALFFPAVTGIMAGANMSGDLRDPGRSIPRGTLLSILVTGIVYASMAFLFGSSASRDSLVTNPLVIHEVAWSPLWITIGVYAATLSSALGSLMGAPRILQALARDHIFRSLRFFAVGHGPASEPRRAVVLSFLIAQASILVGDLDAIAPIITMFFMITYGTLNFATFKEGITRNPSYRPRFRYAHWSLALAGMIGCLAAMFLISPLWATIAILAMMGIHHLIGRHEIEARFGDVHSGTAFERARRGLLELEKDLRLHPKNWRPVILALSGSAWSRVHVALYGHWLTGGRGVLSLAQIIVGDLERLAERRRNQFQLLRDFIGQQELSAFPSVVVAPTLTAGIQALVQCQGIGGFQPNTVVMGWTDDPEKRPEFDQTVRTVASLGRNVICVRAEEIEDHHEWTPPEGTIDVWWRGQSNGSLMLLLAHLLTLNPLWRNKKIRLLRMIASDHGVHEARRHLRETIDAARIDAEPMIVVGENAARMITHVSARAALVVLGFNASPSAASERTEEPLVPPPILASLDPLGAGLPRVVYVHSTGGMDLFE
ncbi:MAG: amino acid permease [Planctomycetes bacterium]|nr:amino acid permease [Planctomycetota bacterium]